MAEQYRTPTKLHARVQLHQRFGTNPEPWTAWVFDRLQLGPDCRVLELGGGSGLLWEANRSRLPLGCRVTLTDLSPGMIAHSFGILSNQPAVAFAVCDAQFLPFTAGAFHVVVANHMLYHVPDRTRVYAEVLRVLKPGGRFFAATNDTDHMQEIAALARAYRPELDRVFVAANERYPFDTAFAELGARFRQLQLHRFANRLIVTDASALADYMLSGLHGGPAGQMPAAAASAAEIGDFRRWLAAEMAARGGRIEINPATGLFEAAKAP